MQPAPFQKTLFDGSARYKKRRVRSRPSQSPAVETGDSVKTWIKGQSRDVSATPTLAEEDRPFGGSRESDMSAWKKLNGADDEKPKRKRRPAPYAIEPVSATDTTERSNVCPFTFCRKMFKRQEHLKRHLRTHTLEKPFPCDVCQKAFSRQDNLVQHMRVHSKDGTDQQDRRSERSSEERTSWGSGTPEVNFPHGAHE